MYYKGKESLFELQIALEFSSLGLAMTKDVNGGKGMWTMKETCRNKHCSFQDVLVMYLEYVN